MCAAQHSSGLSRAGPHHDALLPQPLLDAAELAQACLQHQAAPIAEAGAAAAVATAAGAGGTGAGAASSKVCAARPGGRAAAEQAQRRRLLDQTHKGAHRCVCVNCWGWHCCRAGAPACRSATSSAADRQLLASRRRLTGRIRCGDAGLEGRGGSLVQRKRQNVCRAREQRQARG